MCISFAKSVIMTTQVLWILELMILVNEIAMCYFLIISKITLQILIIVYTSIDIIIVLL